MRGLPKHCRGRGYWWYVIQRPEVDVCLKDPGFDVDAIIRADLAAFTRLSLGYIGLEEVVGQGKVAFTATILRSRSFAGLCGYRTVQA